MSPLVSIIMPAYNAEKTITESINSVLKQSFINFELIICDDVSLDKTPKIIESFLCDTRIKFIRSKTNVGPAISRNKCIEISSGRYLTFIDADDLWDNNFLESQISFINKKNASIVFSSYRRVNAANETVLRDFIVPSKVSLNDIYKSNSISCLTVFIDSELVSEINMPNVGIEDFGCWIKILKDIDYAYGNQDVLASYRILENSRSRNKFKLINKQWNTYRKVGKLNIVSSFIYLAFWAVNGYKKYR